MGGNPPAGQSKQPQYPDACVPSGRNVCLGFQIWSKFSVSGPRLFLIQGLCALVSVNTEINTTLQSAPFINGVTHLMRASLTHINLPLRRGPSRNCGQLPAWILSASAAGRSSHPASAVPPAEGRKQSLEARGQPNNRHRFKGYLIGLLRTLLFILFSFQTNSHGWIPLET